MTDDTRYGVCGTSALEPAALPGLCLYDGGRVHGPVSARGSERAAGRRVSVLLVSLVAVLVAVAVAAVVCAVDAHSASDARARFDAAPHEVTYVQQGDSLWSIAQRQGGDEVDTAQLVSWIRDANALAGLTLHEGEAVVVPVLQQ